MAKLIIKAEKNESQYWRDLWRYRELFVILAWRDIAVRYKQTFIGVAWAVIRPLLTMVIFSVVFGRIAKLPSSGIPYPLFVFAGMMPWQFFANSLTEASGSLVENENLITKVYFPRMIVPSSAVIVSLMDFLISFAILAGMLVWYHYPLTWRIALLPCFVGWAFLLALGPGLLITTLNVKYRDFRYVIPFLVQFGLYVSPVGFGSDIVPLKWRTLYSFNPMVGVIEGFRWSICGKSSLNPLDLVVSVAMTGIFLWIGISSFRRLEQTFADII